MIVGALAGRGALASFTLLLLLFSHAGLSACDQPNSIGALNVASSGDAEICPSADFDPVASLENLLRGHSQLLVDFESLLHKAPENEETVAFLDSFEDLLRRLSTLLSEFESILKIKWYELDSPEQEAFLCSFDDLIDRQSSLIKSFELLISREWTDLDPQNKTKLLASFEDLLRRESDLLRSYEELYKRTHGGILITKSANGTSAHRGDVITYTYIVENTFRNRSIVDVSILDDALGPVASGVILRQLEIKAFYKSMRVTDDTCNRAIVSGKTVEGQLLAAKSNVVCVRIIRASNNYDFIKTGNQISRSFASQQPLASNSIEIRKSQGSREGEYNELSNAERVQTGDQDAFSAGTGGSNNSIRIILDQH